jgi:esterase/lipase
LIHTNINKGLSALKNAGSNKMELLMKFIEMWERNLKSEKKDLERIQRQLKKYKDKEKNCLAQISRWIKTIEEDKELYEKKDI